ncbi:MAG: septum formation initiator family protein [Patescibacteria group bacterium]|nr:septum formation initiator family protein [Patescibacteria group bacterium]
MAKSRDKNIIIRILLNPKTLALFGLIIIVLISLPLAKNISRRYRVNQEIKDLEQEIAGLEDNNINLKKFINYLTSDQFVEKEARLNLGLKKPGEEAAVIKIENANEGQEQEKAADSAIFNPAGSSKNQPIKILNNPQKWQRYFFE